MQRIQTGGNFHTFYFIYGVSVCEVNTCFFQSWSSVGEFIFNHQVLGTFCVYERSNIGSLGSNHRGNVFHTGFFQVFTYRICGSWCDFINHGPWEGNLFFIGQIFHKTFFHKAFCQPFFCHGKNGILQLFTIVGAVIHGNNSQGSFSCFIAFI